MPVNVIPPRDESGRPVGRYAITEDGWAFLADFLECKTSTLGHIYNYDENNVNNTNIFCKFYDGSNVELTNQNDIDLYCVKSVFTFKPNIDIEIVSGEIHQYERPLSNMRLHAVIGLLDPNGNHLSVKKFVKNLNMKFKDSAKDIVTDGRAPKKLLKNLEGVPYDANQIQIIVYHDAGIKHEFMVELEYYRP